MKKETKKTGYEEDLFPKRTGIISHKVPHLKLFDPRFSLMNAMVLNPLYSFIDSFLICVYISENASYVMSSDTEHQMYFNMQKVSIVFTSSEHVKYT